VIVAPPALNVVEAVLGRVSVVIIARAKSPRPSSRRRTRGLAGAGLELLEVIKMSDDGRSTTALRVPARISEQACDFRTRLAREMHSQALPVKHLRNPEFATIACRRPDFTRSCGNVNRRRLDPYSR